MDSKINFNPYTYTPNSSFNCAQSNMSSPYYGDFNCNYDPNYSYGSNFKGDMYGLVKKYEPAENISKAGSYGIEQYNKLTEAEKIALRSSIDNPNQIDDILRLTNIVEDNLKQRYPNGFKIVGIGRSPSLMMEILKAKGYDATSCPISNLTNGEYDIAGRYGYLKQLDKQDVSSYNEVLKSLGITAEEIKNSGKPTVFVDYTRTGNSLKSFQDLIARSEIGIDKRLPIEFLSLNKDLIPNKTMADVALIDKYWENLGIKQYSFMPKVDISEIGKAKEILKNFRPTEESCKFLLQIIDTIKTRKI